MAGAGWFTTIGSGYCRKYDNEPLITVVKSIATNTFVVCKRSPKKDWKEVVADFKDKKYAETFAKQLRKGKR